MTIDWNVFTPWSAFGGGLLIGLAAALFILINGRIAGISGILAGALRPKPGDTAWRLAFIIGLFITPMLFTAINRPLSLAIDSSYSAMILAGLLVGFGTRLGLGCTSGHGVCGLSRLSPRSIVATICFMAAGFITVFLIRHVLAI